MLLVDKIFLEMKGGFTKPLLVDSQTGSILDGHHRYSVALSLELKRVPVILIDYLEDDEITVDVWPGCGLQSISKQDVINMCLSEELYPPKTSKHTIANHMPVHLANERWSINYHGILFHATFFS